MIEVLKYIHENIEKPLVLSDVARQFGYSTWYFCSKFHEFTGRSFVKYIRHYRIQLAAMDILQGKKVSDIALEYGYEGPAGFNKAFLAEYGCLPREYKKRVKETQFYCERRRGTMYTLTDRCAMLRDIVMNRNEYEDLYCAQSPVYLTLGRYKAMKEEKSNAEIISSAVSNMLERFCPVILPGELIVGFNFPDFKYGEYYVPEDTEEGHNLMKQNHISDEDAREYFAVRDEVKKTEKRILPELSGLEQQSMDEMATVGTCRDSNHSVVDYEKVLRLGYEGILKEIEAAEQHNGTNSLYAAMRQICISACKMGGKYAEEAGRLLESGGEEYSTEDLRQVMENCRVVPAKPAKTFCQAVQSLFFAHIINTWEDHINANSLGRLDQILYPYYETDLKKGIITRQEAFEIICCLWIKLYRKYDVQQSCVGGTAPDGNSQVNELSYMMLDATEQLDFVRCMSVRYSQKTEKEFMKRALEVVGHVQKGVPFFFNDDVVIPALMSKGIARQDAYGYTQIGCVETVIPGKSNPHAVTGGANLLKALEYVLCNGYSMMYPESKTGIETGELETLDTYEKFYEAVLEQISHILNLTCGMVKKFRECSVVNSPRPYKSMLTEGCITSGRDFNDAGAIYDYYQIMLEGVPNLADSLEAIREFVYRQHRYSLQEVKEILQADFPDECVRMEFINKAAKYGNDIDSVDSIAVNVVNYACDCLEIMSDRYGLSFHAQPFTFWWMIDRGQRSAATPDGRRKGEILAYSVSPMQGRDFSGLTAVLNSISKFPTKRTPGTTSAIVEVDPKLFTDHNIDMLTEILLAASARGLNNVQFNTIDADTLLDAQKYPEKYNNLAVRVSGFSQKFNQLSPELQNHIIGRTKHVCI